MTTPATEPPAPEWFRALLDTASDVYFRYALLPPRGFVYMSPSVHQLTGRTPAEFYRDPALCFTLLARTDRSVLRQVLHARRGRTLTLHLVRHDTLVPVALRIVVVTRRGRVVAIEGVVTPASDGAPRDRTPDEPSQQRLAALMYEVHDLLHRTLPATQTSHAEPSTLLRLGDLALDPERLVVTESGRAVALTSRELMVLRYFLQRPGRVVTRDQLLEGVWDYRYTGDPRTVDVHLSRLRRKLPSLRARLVAIKHVGYRLDADDLPRRAVGA